MSLSGIWAPIALFAYNRLDHLRRTVDTLAQNEGAGDSDLIVFSDGPRNQAAAARVAEVRAWLPGITGFKSVRVVEREQNFGLAKSIVGGVTELLAQHDRVIVLEDDMVTSPFFLRYMNEALELYAGADEVASIHGYVYPVSERLPETFFLRGADCWGWATWQRGWALFEPDGAKLLAELERRGLTRDFDFDGTASYTRMLQGQISGRNDSWAVRWYASAFLAGKLTLYPGRALVHNIGNDGSGQHCGDVDTYATVVSNRAVVVTRIACTEDAGARRVFADFFAGSTRAPRLRLLFQVMRQSLRSALPAGVKRGLRRLLGRDENPSADYRIIDATSAEALPGAVGWQQASVAQRQHECFVKLLAALRAGRPRADFAALAQAFTTAGRPDGEVIEIGCGSGWNLQVLETMCGGRFRYTGLDISPPMIELAQRCYPRAQFRVGDALHTGFGDEEFDVVVSGTVLMHLADYSGAIRECRRLTRQWCIFHTVPVMQRRATTLLRKIAYGEPTVEVVFNEGELLREFARHGLQVVGRWDSLPYDLKAVVGEPTETYTYLCRVH